MPACARPPTKRRTTNGPGKGSPREAGPEAEREEAKQYCLRLLTLRALSEYELRVRLERRGAAPDTVQRCLADLGRVGLVDDEAFAAAWVESQMRLRPMGRWGLVSQLRGKGIERALAERAVNAAVDSEAEQRAAAEIAGRYLAAGRTPAAVRRAQGALARRGFNSGIIWQVIEAISATGAEE